MKRRLPEYGELRRTRRFAFLPLRTDDGYFVWFDWYTRVDRYCRVHRSWVVGWVAQDYLYEEKQND